MKSINFYIASAFLCFCLVTISSCGDDEVTGCMDSAADNFNPNATVSGNCVYSGCTDPDAENFSAQATVEDNTCVYARDKFIGEYMGTFMCPGILAQVNADDVVFTIENGLDPNKKNEVIVTLLNISGFDIPLTATAVGSNLTDISAELLGIPVVGVTSDVTGTGMATLNANETELTASVILTVVNILGTIEGDCTLIGVKQ